jgi:acetylcholinesterase
VQVLIRYILPSSTLHLWKSNHFQVGHHLLRSTDKALPFKRVILESGAATARAVYTPSNPLHEEQFQEFLQRLHIPSLPKSQILPALRAKTFSEIKSASGAIFEKYDPSVRWPFQPVIDGPGGMIPIAPITAWKAGICHRVPILTGFNANEGSIFVPENASTAQEFTDFFQTLLPSLSKYDLDLLNEVYPDPLQGKNGKYKETKRGLGAQFTRLEQAYGHFAYVAPVLQTALFASASPVSPSNSTLTSKEAPPVYLYEFALPTDATLLAYHGSHGPFITHNPEISRLSPTVNQMSNIMHAYWASFIVTGDPNAVKGKFGDRVVWPRFNADMKGKEGNMLVFGEGNTELIGGKEKGECVRVGSDVGVREVCAFWMERTELFEI